MKSQKKNIQGVNWDLSDLYFSISDPMIEKDKNFVFEKVIKLEKDFKGKINSSNLTDLFLISFLEEVEKILTVLSRIGTYSTNLFNSNTSNKEVAKFYQATREFISKVSGDMAWVDLELTFIPDEVLQSVLKNHVVSLKYKEHLLSLRVLKSHRLTESEEKLITKMSQSGANAFKRFYNETFSKIKYPFSEKNKINKLSYEEIVSVMRTHGNREKRKEASESLSKTLKENSYSLGYILNTLLLDKKIEDEIRNFSFPQQETFLTYRVDKEVVDALVETTQKYYKTVEKFYKQKAKLLKLKKLYEYDRYTPILDIKSKAVTWEEAKQTVLKSFELFSPKFSKIAEEFFVNNWVDSKVVEGKTSGAYCHGSTPSHHPLVLMNFVGRTNDISTLAHELGHGIHDYLSRNQNLLSYYPSVATAEIASIFAEMVTFDFIYNSTTNREEKLNLLGESLQGIFATIFRQIAFYLFESDVHDHRREKGELTVEEFGKYFQSRLQEMFGKGLELSEGHSNWWGPISHFYKYNFYVFTYAFGQALSLALYAKYKKEGAPFVEKYIRALSLGGSMPPEEIISTLGVDIKDKNFWNEGLEMIDKKVEEFIKLSEDRN